MVSISAFPCWVQPTKRLPPVYIPCSLPSVIRVGINYNTQSSGSRIPFNQCVFFDSTGAVVISDDEDWKTGHSFEFGPAWNTGDEIGLAMVTAMEARISYLQ